MCNKPIVFMSNRSKYCSAECRNIAKKARDRVYRQNKTYIGHLRCCDRCHEAYDALATKHKRWCPKCVEIMGAKPETRKCLQNGCSKEISIKHKRCTVHQKQFAEIRRIKVSKDLREKTQELKKAAEERGITKDNSGINKEFLTRGKIRYERYGDGL